MLYHESNVCMGGSIVQLIIRQTESIKFTINWDRIGKQVYGKLYKAVFTKNVFQARFGNNKASDGPTYLSFKMDFQKTTSTRILLHKLFFEVHNPLLDLRAHY